LQIIDGRGRLLQTKAVPAGTQTQQLSVGQFPAGIYYLRWIDGRRQEMWKWVKG
ncbi:MAG: T9SS type A sorting domain-containing protein, partial [Saprospiraceae bacterium]|nr:T9SS type A sorting domain-containing protein [Saprospiraceae bacterium]